jgi:excisionase family DNA binding protein
VGRGARRGATDPALTTRDCADWLGVPVDYIYGEIADDHLPAFSVGRGGRQALRIRLSDFVAYLKARGYARIPTRANFPRS